MIKIILKENNGGVFFYYSFILFIFFLFIFFRKYKYRFPYVRNVSSFQQKKLSLKLHNQPILVSKINHQNYCRVRTYVYRML